MTVRQVLWTLTWMPQVNVQCALPGILRTVVTIQNAAGMVQDGGCVMVYVRC
jgi:hypothetical protein